MTHKTQHARKLANLLFDLDKNSLHHTVELNPSEARYFTRLSWQRSNDVGAQTGYGLRAWQAYQLIKLIDANIPRQDWGNLNGAPNPNNGKTFHTYTIGREYSRVIYVNIPTEYLTRHAKRAGIEEDIKDKIKYLAESYRVDEFDTIFKSHFLQFRLWWD